METDVGALQQQVPMLSMPGIFRGWGQLAKAQKAATLTRDATLVQIDEETRRAEGLEALAESLRAARLRAVRTTCILFPADLLSARR